MTKLSALIALALFAGPAQAQTVENASARDVALAFVDAINTGRFERIPDLIADDAVFVMPGRMPISGTHAGKAAIMRFMGAAGEGLEPGSVRIDVRTVVDQGPYAVLEWRHTSRTRDGRPYSNDYLMLYEVRDGRAVAIREYVDTQKVADTFYPLSATHTLPNQR